MFIALPITSDNRSHAVNGYNARYTRRDSDLPHDHACLIPAPDNSLSIFLFHLRREGYGAQPRGSSAEPQRDEEALLAGELPCDPGSSFGSLARQGSDRPVYWCVGHAELDKGRECKGQSDG